MPCIFPPVVVDGGSAVWVDVRDQVYVEVMVEALTRNHVVVVVEVGHIFADFDADVISVSKHARGSV